MQALKNEVTKEFSQFEITTDLLRNLYKFNLTPATKLVLLELTTHLNENKNGSVVFPSTGYIAEVLGIGLTAAKKAINDLIKEGIIIKSKRDKIKGNYNKYIFTKKVQNTAYKQPENELLKRPDSELFLLRTNNKETNKEQTGKNKTGGNVYEDDILREYAIKHNARNIEAYITTLKQTKSAEKIICEYKKKNFYTQRALHSIEETQNLLKSYEAMKLNCVTAQECGCSIKNKKALQMQS